MVSHKKQAEFFDKTANDASLWEMRAGDLHRASRVLRKVALAAGASVEADFAKGDIEALFKAASKMKDFVLINQAAMLQAFSVECYLKCLWLKHGNTLAKDGKYVGVFERENHDLVKLSAPVKFALSKDEAEVLTFLSVIGKGFGRYPVPRTWQERPLKTGPGGVNSLGTWGDHHHDVTEVVIARLQSEMKAAPPAPTGV